MIHDPALRKGSKKRLGAIEITLILSLAIFSLPGLVELVALTGG